MGLLPCGALLMLMQRSVCLCISRVKKAVTAAAAVSFVGWRA